MSALPRIAIATLRAALATVVEAALLAWGCGGVNAMLAEPRALALLALWFGIGVALNTTRPVRGQRVEHSRPDALAMAALALLPLAIPALAAWGGRTGTWSLPAPQVVGWVGVGVAVLGLSLRVAAMRQLGARFSPLVALQQDHTLETRGWYAHVRHPGYLGAIAASLGTAVAFGSAVALPWVAVMLAVQVARIRREETLLAGRFGEAWIAYASRTGALWPRWGPPAR